MSSRKVVYILFIVGAFILGTQMNIDFKTSQVINSDVIAIVNNDQRIEYGDQTIKFGDEIIKQIEYTNSKYDYQVVSSAEASQGIVSGKFAASIVIPSNLSASIASINTDAPKYAEVSYELNSKLTEKNTRKVEEEINSILFKTKDNLTYMYVYSIFDSLHDTQEGISIAFENQVPVYDFLAEVLEVNVVTNHEYELTDNNTDSFEIIDISQQLEEFNNIIRGYQENITNVISVYKIENNEYNQQINSQISKFEENTDNLNDGIKNVSNTLNNVVETNEQYTQEQYSITKSRSNIQAILQDYFTQLSNLNTINETNRKLNEDSNNFKQSYNNLQSRSSYSFLIKLLKYRNSYYSSVDQVNNCLNGNSVELNSCLDGVSDNFESEYSSYESMLEQFESEKKYQQSLSYYISQIGKTTRTDEAKENENIDIITAAEYGLQDDKQILSDEMSPTLLVDEYVQPGYNDYYFVLKLDNSVSQVETYNLNYSSENVSNITALNEENIVTTKDSITFNNLMPIKYSFVFKVEKNDVQATVSLDYQDQLIISSSEAPVNLDSEYEYNVETKKLTIYYSYVYDELKTSNDALTYVNSKLWTGSSTKIISGEDRSIDLTSNGFLIDNTSLENGQKLDFRIEFVLNKEIGAGINVNSYIIDDVEYSQPLKINNDNISTSINVYDDPYNIEGDKISKDDDDIESGNSSDEITKYKTNNTIDENETVGLKVNMSMKSKDIVNVSQLQFKLNLPDTLFDKFTLKSNDIVGIMFEHEIIETKVQVKNNIITLDFNKPITLTTEDMDEESGLYEYSIDVYINAQVNENITLNTLKDKYYAQLSDFTVVINDISNDLETYADDNFSLSVGQLENQAVTYTVNEDSCLVKAKMLADCEFEAGETITRTITIDNNSSKAASGVKITESFDKGTLNYVNEETSYNLVGLDEETQLPDYVRDNYISQFQTSIVDTNSKEYYVDIPATTQVQIIDQITIDEYIGNFENVNIEQQFTQFNTNLLIASQELAVKPIILEMSNLEGVQIVDDGIITENEAVEISFRLKNTSSRGISTNNNVVIENNIYGIIDTIEVISVVDENWYDVSYTTGGNANQYTIHINKDLKAGESIEFRLKLRFNDLKTSESAGVISIKSFKNSPSKPDTSESIITQLDYDYIISASSYLQLAKDQLATKEVVKGETYAQTYDQSTKILIDMSELNETLTNLKKYVFNYAEYIKTIDSYTTLSNVDINQIKLQLKDYGLGYESKDDDDYLAFYDYCDNNNEVSCRLFSLYNKIYTAEDDSKQYFSNLLTVIDPELEIVTEEKTDDNGQELNKPANVGADFNGYGDCDYSELDEDEECELTEVGIWQRIDNQKDDIDDLNDKIDLILDNEVAEVDKEPYKAKLSDNNTAMNSEMDKVEATNNELFNKKINIYDDNYQAVNEYLQKVVEDETYINLVEEFETDETARQEVTKEILDNTYELMPNTYLDGIPNKLVYTFIANPLVIEDSTENVTTSEEIKSSINTVYVYIFIATTITLLILGFITWKLTRGV